MSKIIGIDLGTTYSVIAKLNDTGKPEIIENAEGKNVTPSVVEFTSETGVVVGESAKALADSPTTTPVSDVNSTTEGVTFFPSAFSIISGLPVSLSLAITL